MDLNSSLGTFHKTERRILKATFRLQLSGGAVEPLVREVCLIGSGSPNTVLCVTTPFIRLNPLGEAARISASNVTLYPLAVNSDIIHRVGQQDCAPEGRGWYVASLPLYQNQSLMEAGGFDQNRECWATPLTGTCSYLHQNYTDKVVCHYFSYSHPVT